MANHQFTCYQELSTPEPAAVLPRTALVRAVATVSGRSPGDGGEALRVAEEFETAIAPRRLSALFRDRTTFESRLAAFLAGRQRTDAQEKHRARKAWGRLPGMTPPVLDRLAARVPLARLRTYGEKQLEEIGRHFLTWGPLLRLLEENDGPQAHGDPRLGRLLVDLRQDLARFWRHNAAHYDADDAVQDALLAALHALGDPGKGYTFEGDLPGWLFATAANRLRVTARRSWRQEDLSAAGPLPAPEVESPAEVCQLLDRWRERYLLVESFFRPAVQSRVKAIWAAMLRWDEEADVELAGRIGSELGEPLPLATLAGTRRRLRQRLEVLRFVLDGDAPGEPDEPGDRSALERVRQRWGLAPADVPTLRHLAALARAANGEPTLAWALVAHSLVDLGLPPEEVRTACSRWLGKREACGADPRLEAALDWMRDPDHQRTLRELRQETKLQRVGFLVSPCWYLGVLRRMPYTEIQAVLRPALEEEPWLRAIAGRLVG
jgi:DNA-directed RNA polymerase specialized sigma24 family protein